MPRRLTSVFIQVLATRYVACTQGCQQRGSSIIQELKPIQTAHTHTDIHLVYCVVAHGQDAMEA
eukprot:1161741-Pelagomonas_calceolata.AAC.12